VRVYLRYLWDVGLGMFEFGGLRACEGILKGKV